MTTKQNGNGVSTGAKVGMGAAAAALAAAAGAYYFYGAKDAAKNRKDMKGWMVKAKGEVMEKMEKLKDVSQGGYEAAVTQVVDKYKKVKNIDPAEIAALASELRGHWKRISGHLKTPATPKRLPAKRKTTKK